MSLTVMVLFAVGLVLLVAGAEVLVKGASRLAAGFRISPLVIGLTVVAFGTSAPEMAVSAGAAVAGQGDIALGNVLGSNIFNVLFILGLAALISPLVVSRQLIRLDVPLMIGATVLVILLSLDGELGLLDGALLMASIIGYTGFLVISSRRANRPGDAEELGVPDAEHSGSMPMNVLFIIGGLVMLVLGARWLVDGAVSMATAFGLSERVIALTIVAAGTSLPEVATSVIASIRGQRDIAVGNVVGSNLFNLLAVLGLAGLLSPDGVQVSDAVLRFDMLVALAVAIACLPIFFSGFRITRWEGLLFLAYYVVYTGHLVMAATGSVALGGLQSAVLYYALPLTALTLLVLMVQGWRERHKH
ncbi:cation:H+ antiporter [Halopseudomonas xinjiangensis]|uniref:Cation:H+ antiporter n=1 Tax=Halopseudomonas xinjiangensis TaxID=487184 RepID=A0A1H1LX82_9GAMM|nr:calcium/sodium antiporter [Halopseudomonas xinjiangensis]SDR78409.1 cation:H+ antiporter [Halopseudomonas xinjiangensis]